LNRSGRHVAQVSNRRCDDKQRAQGDGPFQSNAAALNTGCRRGYPPNS
jgi:hypothetical protein